MLDYYGDRDGREDRMLTFTSTPFAAETELTGHPVVQLDVATSERDASLFAYLSEVDAGGRSRFITEGTLRLPHRATADCPPSYRTTRPCRTFYREDADLMEPGAAETARFALLPVSWQLQCGSRVRMAIAGAGDRFAQVPHGRPPLLKFTLGGADASFIDLPMKASSTKWRRRQCSSE